MKQKITIKLQINCEAKRKKAMVVAASRGADSVALEGEDKNQLVVVGENVDSACLTHILRRKVGRATILKVEEVKKAEEKKAEDKKKEVVYPFHCSTSYPPCPQLLFSEYPNDPNPFGCSIL
ncbi:heavy metal-associated isoprenylated plant protein 47-like [Typha angustifolia]|uniref:heavy metal-associated isoprenylated plant protein 47-like n=1 Tax=Typha angustifolia TaxID=59011 RepID=UPI003C2C125C